MVTIKQIAAHCGVSIASVSKALNNAPDIGAETAMRIREAARELGYYPNAAARALKTNRSYNIGVLFVDKTACGLTHEYFSQVLNSLKETAESHGYDITFISRDMGGTEMTYYEHCRYRKVDGVVIASVDFNDPMVVELSTKDLPIVTIDHIFNNHSAIMSDNVQSMRDLVEYVYSKGHRKIAYIHGEDTMVTKNRLASFHRTCESLGLNIPNEYIQDAIYHDPKSSTLATRKLLELNDRPTCILYPDDFSFIGGMNELEKWNLRIGEDISVAGYDGIYLSQVLRPRLTTLRQDTDALGKKAAEKLIEEIESPKTYIAEQVVVPGCVWEGDTVREVQV